MHSAFVMFNAALFAAGSASGQQRTDTAQAAETQAADQGAVPAPVQTESKKSARRRLRDQLLNKLRSAVVNPPPTITTAELPAPTEPAATPSEMPAPEPDRPSVSAPPAETRPAEISTAPVANPAPMAGPQSAASAAPAAAPQRPPPPSRVEKPKLRVEPAPGDPPTPVRPLPLLGLLAVLVTSGAAALHWRRRVRLARTRAALTLDPRIDYAAGACSTAGLSFAAPPVSIRAYLAHD